MIINNFFEKPATIYLHKDPKTNVWASNYELTDIWPCFPSYLNQGWNTDQFVKTIEVLPNFDSYFKFREYSKDAAEQNPGYYLIHYGTSRTICDNVGFMFLDPGIRDLINRGKLTLLVVFGFETFDSSFSPQFWISNFCLQLSAMGITKKNSVKILVNTYSEAILDHKDSRVSWIYYPYFELLCQFHYKGSFESIPQRDVSDLRNYRFLNLNRRPRNHRLLFNVYLEFKRLNHHGCITWPGDQDKNYYDTFYNPDCYFAEIKHNTQLETFMIANKQLKGNYVDSFDSDSTGSMSCQYMESLKYYNMADFEIISETHSNNIGSSIFLTEKTFRSLFAGIPFMLLGNPGSLKLLHRLGYKTYPMLFDENYNNQQTELAMISSIVSQIGKFCGDNIRTNPFNTEEVIDVINHNQNLFWDRNHPKEIYNLLTHSINFD